MISQVKLLLSGPHLLNLPPTSASHLNLLSHNVASNPWLATSK